MAQSGMVARQITQTTGIPVELVVIRTRGDQVQDRPLAQVGGKGLFTKEIEQALLDVEVDFAVHSLKDLPGEMPDGLALAATPRRADPRDALIGSRLADLPQGAVVGTGSLRRKLQLAAIRPDLDIQGIRGNVDTRVLKQRSGEFHAIVLAAAGLERLDRTVDITEFLSVEQMIPAPGQGALAIQCRAKDDRVLAALATIDDARTRIEITAERAFLDEISGGCSVPAACYAQWNGEKLAISAFYAASESTPRRTHLQGTQEESAELGRRAARELKPK